MEANVSEETRQEVKRETEDRGVGSSPEPMNVYVPSSSAVAEAKASRLSPSSPSTSSPKRSRRSVQKRVVQMPIAEAEAMRPKGAAEGAPPSDSWAWRKYGQKPIKGSPYPRGYYRCSSSKGCPARKQVERSRTDPTMLVITYSCEHNHPWPLPKNHHRNHSSNSNQTPIPIQTSTAAEAASPMEDEEELTQTTGQQQQSPLSPDQEEKFSDLIAADEPSLMMTDEFNWFSTDISRSSDSASPPAEIPTLLYEPIYNTSTCSAFADEGDHRIKENEEEDSLFAGLGELPEFSMVFRRSLPAATVAAASTG